MHGSSWALIHWKVLKLSVFTNYYVDLKVTWESDLVIYIFFGYESDMMDMFFSFFFYVGVCWVILEKCLFDGVFKESGEQGGSA